MHILFYAESKIEPDKSEITECLSHYEITNVNYCMLQMFIPPK